MENGYDFPDNEENDSKTVAAASSQEEGHALAHEDRLHEVNLGEGGPPHHELCGQLHDHDEDFFFAPGHVEQNA